MGSADERSATGRKPNGQFGNGNGGRRKGSRNKIGRAGLTAALVRLVDPEAAAAKLWELASKGDVQALKYIYDRIDGSPPKTLTLEGNPDKPVHVHHSPRG